MTKCGDKAGQFLHERVVQLSVFVGSSADKYRAVEAARGISGVKSVVNDIKSK